MANYSRGFKSMKNRSNCALKSFLVVLLIISAVHMSESNVEDVSDNPNLIESDNLQSSEDKTDEPLKLMNQVAYFQASDDDDSEQNDASYLLAETGLNSKATYGENAMMRLLRGNRMLLQSNDDSSSGDKMYLVDQSSEIERIRSYLPSLMKLKRLVKKCQCSYRDEDQYSSIKDAMPSQVDHRINLDYVDSDEESDDDDRDEDDDSQYGNVLRQRNLNYKKYKRFDLNKLRDDEDMETENEDFETVNRFNEVKEEKDGGESDLDEVEENVNENNGEDRVEDDEFEGTEHNESGEDDQVNYGNNLSNNNSGQNEKLLSPFMTNLSPTSSSDLIFNNFNNEMAMNANTLNDQTDNRKEIQFTKLNRITDGAMTSNEVNDFVKNTDEVSNDVSSALSTQYAAAANRGSRRGGGGGSNGKRNLYDDWIIRKKRQAKASKSALQSKKGSSGGKSSSRN